MTLLVFAIGERGWFNLAESCRSFVIYYWSNLIGEEEISLRFSKGGILGVGGIFSRYYWCFSI